MPVTARLLRPRESKMEALLVRIGWANLGDVVPSKAGVVGGVDARTRASDYRRIDELIRRGLVRNVPGGSRGAYALVLTADGWTEVAAVWHAEAAGFAQDAADAQARTWQADDTRARDVAAAVAGAANARLLARSALMRASLS